jgi:hypothetical protein
MPACDDIGEWGEGLCAHPGCTAPVTHNRSVWVNADHMRVEYFCPRHAPADADLIGGDEEDDRWWAEGSRRAFERWAEDNPW